jgi:hypothetical protein
MILRTPPFQMVEQLWRLLRRGPGSTCERSYAMTDRQIDPFNKRCVQPAREAQSL